MRATTGSSDSCGALAWRRRNSPRAAGRIRRRGVSPHVVAAEVMTRKWIRSPRARSEDLNRGEFLEGSTPRHQLGVRSSLDLPARFQIDGQFRHLSAVRQIPQIVSGKGCLDMPELDLRLAWDGWKQLELSLVGQNLLHRHHLEFGPPGARAERSSVRCTERSHGGSDETSRVSGEIATNADL